MGRRLYTNRADAPIDVGPAVTVATALITFTEMSANNDVYYAPVYVTSSNEWKFAAAQVGTVDISNGAGTGPTEPKQIPRYLQALAQSKIPPFLVFKLGADPFAGDKAHVIRLKDKNNANLSDDNTGGEYRWYPARISKGPKDYLPLGDCAFGSFSTRMPANQLLCFAHKSICYTQAPLSLLTTVSPEAGSGGIPVYKPNRADTTVPAAIKNLYSSFGHYFGTKSNPTMVLNVCFKKQPSRILWYLYDDGGTTALGSICQTVMLNVPITPLSYYINNSINTEATAALLGNISEREDAYSPITSPMQALDMLIGMCIDPESSPNDAYFKIFGNISYSYAGQPAPTVDLSQDFIQAVCDAKITLPSHTGFCPSSNSSTTSVKLGNLKPTTSVMDKANEMNNTQLNMWWPWFGIILIFIVIIIGVTIPFMHTSATARRKL